MSLLGEFQKIKKPDGDTRHKKQRGNFLPEMSGDSMLSRPPSMMSFNPQQTSRQRFPRSLAIFR